MGAEDTRLNGALKQEFRLTRMIAAWKKQDPAPTRVKPIPISVIRRIAHIARHLPKDAELLRAVADMIIIAFFYLLRPGEYTDAASDTTPFTLGDVQLFVGERRINLDTASPAEIKSARAASLTFTTQKNGIRGEVIVLGLSGDPYVCPVLAVVRRVLHLRGRDKRTPLARCFPTKESRGQGVTPKRVSDTLKNTVEYLGHDLGFLKNEVSARSLRAGGAMALLVAKVDPDVIRLLGRWRSDEMLRYLHLSAQPIMMKFARRMLHANYTMAATQLVPMR